MTPKTLRAEYVRYRWVEVPGEIAITLAKRPRAFVASSCGNRVFASGPWINGVQTRWLEIPLAEAINAIVACGFYTHDMRHPLIAAINSLQALISEVQP